MSTLATSSGPWRYCKIHENTVSGNSAHLLRLRPIFLQKNVESDIGDKRVLLLGFYWESYRHGHPDRFPDYGPASWYTLLAEQAPVIRDGRFDLIWLPPPSYAGDISAGYNPKVWYRIDNSYGSEEEHLTLLRTLLAHGIEPIAGIVINHRDGLLGWAHFAEYAGHDGTTYAYPAFRDIDHTNPTVRRDVIRYLKLLQSIGYRGWRYDMVHGYHARWLATYNRATRPTFSVGEYDWDKRAAQRLRMTSTLPAMFSTLQPSSFSRTAKSNIKTGITRGSAWRTTSPTATSGKNTP